MYSLNPFTPPPPLKFLTALGIALMTVMASLPAAAQSVTFHHQGGGTDWISPHRGLVVLGSGSEATRDLKIEARDWPATTLFGVGDGSRCAYDKGGDGRTFNWATNQWEGTAKLMVGFHSASDRYTGGNPIARRCTFYAENKLNPINGMFTVRIYGKACLKGTTNVQRCWDLSSPTPPVAWSAVARLAGYNATFKHGKNCGPPQNIPGLENLAPHAAWCDFTVEIGP